MNGHRKPANSSQLTRPNFVGATPGRRAQYQAATPLARASLRNNVAPPLSGSEASAATGLRISNIAVEICEGSAVRPTTVELDTTTDEHLTLTKPFQLLMEACLPGPRSLQHQESFAADESSPRTTSDEQAPLEDALDMEVPEVAELVRFLDDGVTNASRKINLLRCIDGALKGRRTKIQTYNCLSRQSWPHLMFSSALFRDDDSTAPLSPTSFAESSLPPTTVPTDEATRPVNGNFVLFSFYSFISLNSVWMINQDDATTLESSGCLHLPAKAALKEFVDSFFLHVHPTFPLLHERSFRTLYCGQGATSYRDESISLCVMQTLLLVACPVSAPESVVCFVCISLLTKTVISSFLFLR
jgi:hypothetical protein